MSEAIHERDPLTEVELHYKTLREWVDYLSEDPGLVPCSRYGRDSEECAPWAIACEIIHFEASGETHDEPELNLGYFMGLVVNDADSVLEIVRDYWYAIPDQLKPYLEYDEDGLTMAQYVALRGLCHSYGVDFDTSDYGPQFDLPADYVAGWVGGIGSKKIYVGVSGDGEVSS